MPEEIRALEGKERRVRVVGRDEGLEGVKRIIVGAVGGKTG